MEVGLKLGARATGIKPEIVCVIPIIIEVLRNHNHPFLITALTDGQHMMGSMHHLGLAVDVDFQQRRFSPETGEIIANDLEVALGPDYDVVFEKHHFHIEYDPKTYQVVVAAE